MKLARGYRTDKGTVSDDGRSLVITLHVAWWRVLLIRIFGWHGL